VIPPGRIYNTAFASNPRTFESLLRGNTRVSRGITPTDGDISTDYGHGKFFWWGEQKWPGSVIKEYDGQREHLENLVKNSKEKAVAFIYDATAFVIIDGKRMIDIGACEMRESYRSDDFQDWKKAGGTVGDFLDDCLKWASLDKYYPPKPSEARKAEQEATEVSVCVKCSRPIKPGAGMRRGVETYHTFCLKLLDALNSTAPTAQAVEDKAPAGFVASVEDMFPRRQRGH
jgi:hypothetical protein